jgi:hypothetical protein
MGTRKSLVIFEGALMSDNLQFVAESLKHLMRVWTLAT